MSDSSKNVTLENVRLCFSSLASPTSINGDGDPRYRATLLIEKTDKEALSKLATAAKSAYIEKFGQEAFARHQEGWSGINDGDKRARGSDGLHDGHFYINAKAKARPILVDEAKEPTTKFYDGCYVNVALFAYAYEYKGKYGVGYSFSAMQFAKEGQRIISNSALDSFKVLKPAVHVEAPQSEETSPVSDSDMSALFGSDLLPFDVPAGSENDF